VDEEMNNKFYEYKGKRYPAYLKGWNGMGHVQMFAKFFCEGKGLDVGCGLWPLPDAIPVEIERGDFDANNLPEGQYDYIFSSHCLEHVPNPIAALEHWKGRLKPGGVLFLYLPHPDMKYWLPQNNRKHLHQWWPDDMESILTDLGFENIIRSERDLYWSFAIVGFKAEAKEGENGFTD
jgi:SAM-dependent methyltransferase